LGSSKNNVATSKLAIEEEIIVGSELRIGEPGVDETNIQCNLKLAQLIASNPSDEIPPKTNLVISTNKW
jgi:hypothetical protein